MSSSKDKHPRSPATLPAGFQVNAGRVVAGTPAMRAPRVEGTPEDEGKKAPAAAPRKCSSCEANVPPGAKFCPECGAEMPTEGEDAQGLFDKDAAAFARFALATTGAKSLAAARGVLVAWKDGASKTTTLAAELGIKSERLATIERERLLERAIAEGCLEPSQAWSFSVDKEGNKVRSFSDWAGPPNAEKGTGQNLEQLAAYLAQRPAAAASSRPFTPAPKSPPAVAALPPGTNPELYAAARRQVAAACGEGA